MSFDKGNWDYDHGYIQTKEIKELYIKYNDSKYKNSYNVKDPTKKQEIKDLEENANKNRYHLKSRNIIPYCKLINKHCGDWAHDRKQNTSTIMRRHYKSTANKKTRQGLKELDRQEIDELI